MAAPAEGGASSDDEGGGGSCTENQNKEDVRERGILTAIIMCS